MTRITRAVVIAVVATVGFGLATSGAFAAPQWSDTGRMSDQRLRDLASRIDNGARAFRSSLGQSVNRSQIDDRRWNADINQSVMDFTQAAGRLRDRANRREVVKHPIMKVYAGGSHGLADTNTDQLNTDLLAFLET